MKTTARQFMSDVKKKIPYPIKYGISRSERQIVIRVFNIPHRKRHSVKNAIRKMERKAFPEVEYFTSIILYTLTETRTYYPKIYKPLSKKEK